MDNLWRAAFVVALGYLVFYVYTLYEKDSISKENFKVCRTVLDTSNGPMKPYVTTETSMGDFEQDFIYNNEGGRDSTREAIMMAKRKFPFDWAQLPPDSSLFQTQQAMFVSEPTATAAPYTISTFVDIESKKILPPDTTAEQKEFDAALLQLKDPSSSFAGLYADRRGDIFAAQGKSAEARSAWTQAIELLGLINPLTAVVKLKLDALGA